MADNTVEILVDARAAAAEADLKILKTQLNDLGNTVKTARAKVDVSKEDQAKLARLNAQLITLGRQVSNPKITVEGAAKAEAQILAVGRSLDRLNDKGPGVLSRLGASFVQLGTEAGGLASSIGLILVPIGALIAIISGPLLAALLPIAAGFATFAAVAIPEISKVVKALQAQGPAAKKAWAALSPPEKEIARQIRSLKDDFAGIGKAVQPEILKATGSIVDIFKKLAPALKPLAVAAGKALDGFLKHIDDWLSSSSGKKFIRWMETDGPKAIETFGRVMWDTAQAIGRTFSFLRNAGNTWFRNVHNGLTSIGHAWNAGAGVIAHAGRAIVGSVRADFSAVSGAIRALVSSARASFSAVSSAVHAVAGAFRSAWSAVVGTVRGAASAIIGAVRSIEGALGGIAGAVRGALGALGSIPGKALSLIGLASGGIVGAASGGVHGGLRWVGERGPELVRLPIGSTVYPSGQSQMMAAQQGGGGDTYNIHVQVGPGTAPAEVGRQIAYYLAEHKKRGGMIYRPAGF